MLLAYVDESYTKACYYMAALLVPGDAAVSLTQALDDVVTKAMYDHGEVHGRAELHGYDLVSGKGDWARLAPKIRARIGVYNNALQAIADHDVTVILRGVDTVRLDQRYRKPDHPHSIVLAHLIERVDEFAESTGDLALMIADEVSGQDEYRRNLWEYQRVATRGYRARRITRVVDTIHFAPSTSSRLVQAADLIAYLHRRRQTHVEMDERAKKANEALWARVQPRVHHSHCWCP